jgi:hypothetical protein
MALVRNLEYTKMVLLKPQSTRCLAQQKLGCGD